MIDELRIRAATAADVPAIADIVDQAYRHYITRIGKPPGPMLVDYAARVSEGVVWVVEEGAVITAIIVLLPTANHLLLDNIALSPARQGLGLGRRLLAFAEDEALRRGYREIRLYTHQTMVENQRLYTSIGYEETGRGTEAGYDRVFMRKQLRPLPRREQLDDAGQRTYDSLADPKGGTIRGLRGPGGILLHSPELSRHTRPLNRYLRHEAGLGGRVRELAILTTARELDSQVEWAAHEPEALSEGISQEIIEGIKHRKDTSSLDEADAIVIELGREIFGARKVASATFARSLRQFGRRALVDLVALMGNYAGTAALLTAFDMQLDPGQPPPLPPL